MTHLHSTRFIHPPPAASSSCPGCLNGVPEIRCPPPSGSGLMSHRREQHPQVFFSQLGAWQFLAARTRPRELPTGSECHVMLSLLSGPIVVAAHDLFAISKGQGWQSLALDLCKPIRLRGKRQRMAAHRGRRQSRRSAFSLTLIALWPERSSRCSSIGAPGGASCPWHSGRWALCQLQSSEQNNGALPERPNDDVLLSSVAPGNQLRLTRT